MERLRGIHPNRVPPAGDAKAAMPLTETKADFLELPQASESSDSSSNRIVTIMDLLNEQESSEEMQIATRHDWRSLFNPIFLISSTLAIGIIGLLIWYFTR
jgi:hypothetical protein